LIQAAAPGDKTQFPLQENTIDRFLDRHPTLTWAAGFAGIAALGTGLRVWGLRWGFPLQRAYIDEFVTVFYSLHLSLTGPHPHFFDYPSLFLYGLWVVAAALQELTGLNGFGFAAFVGDEKSVLPILAGRGLSVAAALLSLLLVAAAAKSWKGRAAALAAAGFLAVHPLHVRMSHYAMPDVLATAWAAAGAAAWCVYGRSRKNRHALAAGLALGLGAATKYTPAFLAAGLVAWLLASRCWRPAAGLAAAAGLGFFLGSPYSVLMWQEFFPRIRHLVAAIVVGGGAGPGLAPRLAGAAALLPAAVHPALLILAGAGFVLERKDPVAQGLAVAGLAYFLGIGVWSVVSPHYFLPLLPLLCLFAAAALSRVPGRQGWGLGLAAGLLVTVASVRFLVNLSQRDTRLVALEAIRSRVPAGARVLRFPHTPEFASGELFRVQVDWEGERSNEPPARLLQEFDYVVTASFSPRPVDPETRWEQEARLVLSVSNPEPAFPHHPRVRLWASKE
jgi:hypothetical protein